VEDIISDEIVFEGFARPNNCYNIVAKSLSFGI
jgi:hypothetical protein